MFSYDLEFLDYMHIIALENEPSSFRGGQGLTC